MKYESNLKHQSEAVKSVMKVFEGIEFHKVSNSIFENRNPIFTKNQFEKINNNIIEIQKKDPRLNKSNLRNNENLVLDVQMETGTGKTYTYLQTIFELNRKFGLTKFVIMVPGIAVLEGTKYFLNSEDTRNHFRTKYDMEYELYNLESNDPSRLNPNVQSFSENTKEKISILLTNEGMINKEKKIIKRSGEYPTLFREYDDASNPKLNSIAKIISNLNPVYIIDEAHRFCGEKNAYVNMMNLNPLFAIRYGATYKDVKNKNIYENHIHLLSSADAFNQNLVKKINVMIPRTDYKKLKKNEILIKDIVGNDVILQNDEKEIIVTIGDNIPQINGLKVLKVHKNKIIVEYHNGFQEMKKKGEKFNILDYKLEILNSTLSVVVKEHLNKVEKLLSRKYAIKPLTLIFVQSRNDYEKIEDNEPHVKNLLLKHLKINVEKKLETAEGEFYKYLSKISQNYENSCSGYFSGDKDKNKITKERADLILNKKEELLSIDNPVNFIFSQWTLKEGWDNPNVFQICKLRTSGSETSKLQEIGRGLRLPVDENFNRVKKEEELLKEEFRLNYYVDISEQNFAEQLQNDIKKDSLFKIPKTLTEDLIMNLINEYPTEFQTKKEVRDKLLKLKIIDENDLFVIESNKPLGYEKFEILYSKERMLNNSNITESQFNESGEIEKNNKKLKIRKKNYKEFQKLWNEINKKVIIKYNLNGEEEYKEIIKKTLNIKNYENKVYHEKIDVNLEKKVQLQDNVLVPDYSYSELLSRLSRLIAVKKETIHKAFLEYYTESKIDINNFRTYSFLSEFTSNFKEQMLIYTEKNNCYSQDIIPMNMGETIFTNSDGTYKEELDESVIPLFGKKELEIIAAENYLFEKGFGDSIIENENIQNEISNIIVFSKIPKGSIKIPNPGGGTYSPDFAYVVNYENKAKQINLVIESKGKSQGNLNTIEKAKINIADKLYNENSEYDIIFKLQLENEKIQNIISNLI